MQATIQTVRPITPMNPLPAAVHMNGDATTASVFQTTKDATDIPTAITGKMNTTVEVSYNANSDIHTFYFGK